MMRQAGRYHGRRILLATLLVMISVWWGRDWVRQTQAESLVSSLQSAATDDVPGIVDQIGPVRTWADPLLRVALVAAKPGGRAQLHLSLGLLPVDHQQQDVLFKQALHTTPNTLQQIAKSMQAHIGPEKVVQLFQPVLDDRQQDPEKRFRAAATLALVGELKFDDTKASDSLQEFLVEELIRQIADNRDVFLPWTLCFQSAGHRLTQSLSTVYSDAERRDADREVAAAVLTDYLNDQPKQLVDLLISATPHQHHIVFPALQRHRSQALAHLQAIVDRSPRVDEIYDERSRITERRAHAAALMFALGEFEPLRASLEQIVDVELSSFVEARLSTLAIRRDVLHAKLKSAQTASLRAALLRILGGFNEAEQARLSDHSRKALAATFYAMLQNDPDSGVHSAAEWALNVWGKNSQVDSFITREAATQLTTDRRWHITPSGQTFAVFEGPVESRTGSPPEEPGRDVSDETLSTRRIPRMFAMCTKEVSCEEYYQFDPKLRDRINLPVNSPKSPVGAVTWHHAAAYCLWLSQQEGIPEDQCCYVEMVPAVYGKLSADNRPPVMESVSDYLSRTGYRLATEAEWEYACRAGADTLYSWGNAAKLATRYAWFYGNSAGKLHAGGKLCPNRFGLFDMHGNILEWTQDAYERNLPLQGVDTEAEVSSFPATMRIGRGGSGTGPVRRVRCANRTPWRGDRGSYMSGFRIARTIEVKE